MKTQKWMKYGLLSLALSFSHASASFAQEKGDTVGNGGVTFVCGNKVELVDYWEAKDLGYPLSLGSNPNAPMQDLANEYIRRLSFFESGRAENYAKTAALILKDLEILAVDSHSRDTKLVRFTDGVLPPSLDSDEITQPKGCLKIQAVTQKEPKIEGERLLTIDKNLWNSMNNEMRVLTIFHEINVTESVKLGFLNTTRPARILNRYIGSPEISGTKSVCDYMAFSQSIGMVYHPMNESYVFSYGGVNIYGNDKTTTCWKSTKRLKSAQAVFATSVNVGNTKTRLSFSRTEFDENSSNWTSANLSVSAINGCPRGEVSLSYECDFNIIFEDTFGGSEGVYLHGGVIHRLSEGFYQITDMTRMKFRTGLGALEIIALDDKKIGSADVQFQDGIGTVTETIHTK